MAFPSLPEYITGAYAIAYIAACNEEVQQRFAELQKTSGIIIRDDNKVLHSAELELFMKAI